MWKATLFVGILAPGSRTCCGDDGSFHGQLEVHGQPQYQALNYHLARFYTISNGLLEEWNRCRDHSTSYSESVNDEPVLVASLVQDKTGYITSRYIPVCTEPDYLASDKGESIQKP